VELRVQPADIERMAEKTLLSYGKNTSQKISAYWVLLTLSGIIATAGVVNDSTATVIGAMIVAPLMTPILGSAFAFVMSDRARTLKSLGVVIGGALLVISIAFLFGLFDPLDTVTEGNGQVSGRIHPNLIDLMAALATGLVGAFALVRSDISDTLPGVAIAISLVPPLSVVGLTLEEGKYSDAFGALVLFSTNVTAIIFTATLVLLVYKVRETAIEDGYPVGEFNRRGMVVVVASVALITLPLGYGTINVVRDEWAKYQLAPVAEEWAEADGWKIAEYDVTDLTLEIVAVGPPPELDPEILRETLDEEGFPDINLQVSLVVGGTTELPGSG